MKKENSEENEIPEMKLDQKYSTNPAVPTAPEKSEKEMEKTKKELEKLKNFIVKKYSYTQAIGILPPQAIPYFIEEEEVTKETKKYIHLLVIVPEYKIKEIPKIKTEIIKEVDKIKTQKIWLHINTPDDIWEICLDSKFNLSSAISIFADSIE